MTTLEGAPKEVKGNFYCSNNQLISLEWAPEKVKGNFICDDNSGNFTEEDIYEIL